MATAGLGTLRFRARRPVVFFPSCGTPPACSGFGQSGWTRVQRGIAKGGIAKVRRFQCGPPNDRKPESTHRQKGLPRFETGNRVSIDELPYNRATDRLRGTPMKRVLLIVIALFAASSVSGAGPVWTEGQHYFLVQPPQPTDLPHGKVEVVEVFSYACPACNHFYPLMDKLKASLAPNAVFTYLPASWHPEEDWTNFQRAFFAAQALGLVAQTHTAVFDAIWKTGELATMDPATGRPRDHMPTIADISKFYARKTGITAAAFVAAARSFGVDSKMRQADEQIAAYQVDQTPTIIVNGRYRVTVNSAGGDAALISLVKWLVIRESAHR